MASCLLGIGLMLTGYSCTDSNFDLSDIDTTIGIGGDSLAIPVSSTEDIKLDDILELDNSDLISTEANGDYVFKKEGEAVTPARPQVDKVVITNQRTTNNDLMIAVNTSAGARPMLANPPVLLPCKPLKEPCSASIIRAMCTKTLKTLPQLMLMPT